MGVGSGVLVFVGVLVRVEVAGMGEGVDVSVAGRGVVVGKAPSPAHADSRIEKITQTAIVNNFERIICFLPSFDNRLHSAQ